MLSLSSFESTAVDHLATPPLDGARAVGVGPYREGKRTYKPGGSMTMTMTMTMAKAKKQKKYMCRVPGSNG